MKFIALTLSVIILSGCQYVTVQGGLADWTYLRPDYSSCYRFVRYKEQQSCRRGVDNAFQNELRMRERDAYREGYNSQRY